MNAAAAEFTITELSTLSGVPVRTIRYYVAQGLIPSPGREGAATRYGEATLARLRLVKQLQAAHQPLSGIRERLSALSDDDVIGLAATPEPPPAEDALEYVRSLLGRPAGLAASEPHVALRAGRFLRDVDLAPRALSLAPAEPVRTDAPPTPTPAPPERSQWDRIVLEPDIELHVRRPLSRQQNQRVDRLVAFARQLLEGGPR